MTYTPTCHLLDYYPGLADDWTLGDHAAGLAEAARWPARRRSGASSSSTTPSAAPAGNPSDTAYGRGGGQAAHVGEQAQVHALMLQYGVQIFFYAHDHVFTDMVVDGVHYALPGSAGAPWKFDETETGYTQYWPDSGFARVDVSPARVQVQFVSTTGHMVDSFTLPERGFRSTHVL